jgi:hypothetical protein
MLVRLVSLTALACALAAALLSGVAGAAKTPRPVDPNLAAPQGLTAFLLRADETADHQFPRTPSFAWKPMRGVTGYEFELSASRKFAEASKVWSSDQLKSPAAAVPVVLPWMTGNPYALYARVRAITRTGVSRWSESYGFNMRWPDVPQQLPAAPGLVRWTPVEGATAYHVWMVSAGKIFTAITNVADMRDLYTFHQDWGWNSAAGVDMQWRIRAVREIDAKPVNGLPVVKWGPWSPIYSVDNPEHRRDEPFALQTTISDVIGTTAAPEAHRLTPAFT